MKQKYSFESLPLTDKKMIAMVIRGYFGSTWKAWLSSITVHEEEFIRPNGAVLGLPPEAIKQFQDLCLKKGIKLSEAEATREAYKLINFARVVNDKAPCLDKES